MFRAVVQLKTIIIIIVIITALIQNKQCGRRVRPTRYAPPVCNLFSRLTLKLVCE